MLFILPFIGINVIDDNILLSSASKMVVSIIAVSYTHLDVYKRQVDTLMTLLATYLSKEIKELHANNVKVTAIGDISKLPKNCIEQLNNAFELTKDNTGVNLNLALNYGSRDAVSYTHLQCDI